ncbi:MAG TPA: class I SAM-dependent methyltransferase [Candidatus Ozemobacteraceae bacterium]|nr:class I SAM-dependent methyltransferase [Candidatus Ozemobacteraceae bacterium]
MKTVPTREGYDLWATCYDTEDNCLIVLEEQHIAPFFADARGKRILDLGCGTGRHSFALARQGAHVIGLDFSDGMLRLAREKSAPGALPPQFVSGDLHEPLPFHHRQFDAIGCFLVIEHIRDRVGLFREMRRVCRPGGTIILSAMHPAMFLRQTQAGFPDPHTGCKIQPESHPHSISDLFEAGRHAGLTLLDLREAAVTPELVAQSPKAAKYLGWPLLLLFRWQAP